MKTNNKAKNSKITPKSVYKYNTKCILFWPTSQEYQSSPEAWLI